MDCPHMSGDSQCTICFRLAICEEKVIPNLREALEKAEAESEQLRAHNKQALASLSWQEREIAYLRRSLQRIANIATGVGNLRVALDKCLEIADEMLSARKGA